MWFCRDKRLPCPVAASVFPLRPQDHLLVDVEEPRIVHAYAPELPIEPDHGIMAVAAVVLWYGHRRGRGLGRGSDRGSSLVSFSANLWQAP